MKLPYRRNRHREPKFIETSETLVWDLGAHPEAQGGGGLEGEESRRGIESRESVWERFTVQAPRTRLKDHGT